MVHLSTIKSPEVSQEDSLRSDDQVFSTTIYGSRQAARGLPSHYMPEEEMPPQTAYRYVLSSTDIWLSVDQSRLIHDELALDGNPFLNLASFVTTYMEPEAEQLMHDGMAKNYIDYEEYPATCEIQNKCVAIIGNLFNVPKGKEGEEPMYDRVLA